MLNFNETEISEKIAPHYGELVRIVKQAHSDFLKIPAMDGLNYCGLPYAVIMLVKIKDLLAHSYLTQKGYAEIIPYYNTFRLVFFRIPVSFNKVDNKKRKCKDIIEPNVLAFTAKYFKQTSLFSDDSIYNQHIISNQSPLTIGYTLRNLEISNVYITHQVAKNVHWSEDITEYSPAIIELQKRKTKTNSTPPKRRVFSKNPNKEKIQNIELD